MTYDGTDWSTKQSRIGTLEGLMGEPTNIWAVANDAWADLMPPKAFWIARMRAASGIRGVGKAVIYQLLREMLREFKRGEQALGPEPIHHSDSGRLMAWDCKWLALRRGMAEKYDALLNGDIQRNRSRQRRRTSNVIVGPWRSSEF